MKIKNPARNIDKSRGRSPDEKSTSEILIAKRAKFGYMANKKGCSGKLRSQVVFLGVLDMMFQA